MKENDLTDPETKPLIEEKPDHAFRSVYAEDDGEFIEMSFAEKSPLKIASEPLPEETRQARPSEEKENTPPEAESEQQEKDETLAFFRAKVENLSCARIFGTAAGAKGSVIEAIGLKGLAGLGRSCRIKRPNSVDLRGEVIGFDGELTKILTERSPQGIRAGERIFLEPDEPPRPCDAWLGHIIDAYGNPRKTDIADTLPKGDKIIPLRNTPPDAAYRRGLGARAEANTAVFNSFLPLCRGQRIGLFAGSGVGKSTLLGRLAKHTEADVAVIGLIGERGREVNEFIRHTLGPEGLKRSVVVAATSDESPLIKRRAALMTLSVAEYFRDQGKQVLLMLDSLTRLAEAQREIGLSAGEPPAMRAFPPSAFSELMSLCERAGPGCENTDQGDITAIFTVLVQGGDNEEPVADCVRGTLDGHVVLEREIAERGLYPAIDILKSISRSLPACATEAENAVLNAARRIWTEYNDVAPMVKLGVYKPGAAPETDRAVRLYPQLEKLIYSSEKIDTTAVFERLKAIVETP